eukprot:TRINITY_DN33623_c0_g1_i2.p1 TRINITY_DN33623_c0_g1~~TRINITY_DN33623_c0_g1_i2.p1  ORF type:complete len:422 (-),score=110.38 TRINITY_DN33623_c0_g1_i2:192-1457(-)
MADSSGAKMSGSQFVNRSAQEHLSYIQEKVNPVLEALVTAVLLERPEDPAFFMLKWLCEQTKSLDGAEGQAQRSSSRADEIASVRAEIGRLQDRKAELLALRSTMKGDGKDGSSTTEADGKVESKSERSTKAEDESDEDDEDDDDEVDEVPMAYSRGPRQSVSAEAYGQWNVKAEFVPPVYEKSEVQKGRIESCLEPSFLFSSLEPEGDEGDCMYLLEEGEVDCFKKVDGCDVLVKTCRAGDVFGELALLYNCPRAASVVAKMDCLLWELDRETFSRIVKDAAASKREKYMDFLRKVPLFANVENYEMMTIADALKVEILEETDTQILKQGDPGDKFFIMLEGECVAKKAFGAGQTPQRVKTHKAGDYFGELALLRNEPRAASIFTSLPDTKVLWMNRRTFKRLLGPVEHVLRRQATKRYS